MSIESPLQPEQPKGYLEKKAFTESLMNVVLAKGYILESENEKEKIFEKDGQTIKLVYNFNQSGYISGFASFDYKDNPLMTTSNITFGHQGRDLTDLEVKKTFDEMLKKYETRYDKYLPKYPEIKTFNDQLISLGQEVGYKIIKSTTGRISLENDVVSVKLQHLPYKENDEDLIRTSMIEVKNKETGTSSYSTFQWQENTLEDIVKEQFEKMVKEMSVEKTLDAEPVLEETMEEQDEPLSYADQLRAAVEVSPDKKETYHSMIRAEVEIAQSHHEKREFLEELYALEDAYDLAYQAQEDGICDLLEAFIIRAQFQVHLNNPELFVEIFEGKNEPEEASEVLPAEKSNTTEEQAKADADQIDQLSNEIKDQMNKKEE